MRREHNRHPFFEVLVFGLAIVLVLILVFYGGRTLFLLRAQSGRQPKPTADFAAVPAAPAAELPHELDVGPTERGVNQLPPVEVSRIARPAHRTKEVPVPR
ncbi:MAG: hypothetical protein HY077_04520 [Elusimicrobia bacterium]|nr:hypothetical protein [Elusimicrobiota bacterium]